MKLFAHLLRGHLNLQMQSGGGLPRCWAGGLPPTEPRRACRLLPPPARLHPPGSAVPCALTSFALTLALSQLRQPGPRARRPDDAGADHDSTADHSCPQHSARHRRPAGPAAPTGLPAEPRLAHPHPAPRRRVAHPRPPPNCSETLTDPSDSTRDGLNFRRPPPARPQRRQATPEEVSCSVPNRFMVYFASSFITADSRGVGADGTSEVESSSPQLALGRR